MKHQNARHSSHLNLPSPGVSEKVFSPCSVPFSYIFTLYAEDYFNACGFSQLSRSRSKLVTQVWGSAQFLLGATFEVSSKFVLQNFLREINLLLSPACAEKSSQIQTLAPLHSRCLVTKGFPHASCAAGNTLRVLP